MTRSIEELAREAGGIVTNGALGNHPLFSFPINELERFAQLVREQALEEAAVICDREAEISLEYGKAHGRQNMAYVYDGCQQSARAIRSAARGEKT